MMKNAKPNKKDILDIYNAVKSNNGSVYMSQLKQQFPVLKLVKAVEMLKEKGIVSLGIEHANSVVERVIILN